MGNQCAKQIELNSVFNLLHQLLYFSWLQWLNEYITGFLNKLILPTLNESDKNQLHCEFLTQCHHCSFPSEKISFLVNQSFCFVQNILGIFSYSVDPFKMKSHLVSKWNINKALFNTDIHYLVTFFFSIQSIKRADIKFYHILSYFVTF